jgi:hypothetical protein
LFSFVLAPGAAAGDMAKARVLRNENDVFTVIDDGHFRIWQDGISNIKEVDVKNKARRSPPPSAFPNEARTMTPSKTKENPFQMWQSDYENVPA